MTIINFCEFYKEYNENVLNEGIFTALVGKLGTSIANVFRKRKGINIAVDYLKVFETITRKQYENILNKLTNWYLNETKAPRNPKLFIKDLRFGVVTGSFFGDLSDNITTIGTTAGTIAGTTAGAGLTGAGLAGAGLAGAAGGLAGGVLATAAKMKKIDGVSPFERHVLSKLASKGVANPKNKEDRKLYKSKEHQMDISVYLLSNGGKISLWNIPKTGTKEKDPFDANKRVYAIGLDGAGVKAFESIFGMSYKNWLVTLQSAEEEEHKEERQAEKAEEEEKRRSTWEEIVEIDKNTYENIIKLPKEVESVKNKIEKIGEYPASEMIEKGIYWNITNPEGTIAIYKSKDGKYKIAFTDKKLREWINRQNKEKIKIPSGKIFIAPENTNFKNNLIL